MRCTYMSDLHLESETFAPSFRGGDVLILAGDLCHARCLDPARPDRYSQAQRERVERFLEGARLAFPRILFVPGNHEHYDGVFEDTVPLLRQHLDGVTVLDDEVVEIDGVRFFGATLWTDFQARSEAAMNGVRRRMGEYFFVKKRARGDASDAKPARFRPEDALAAHDASWRLLLETVEAGGGQKTIVITHHAPSRLGANPVFMGNGLDGAYYSDLDRELALMEQVPVWVHGHTHVAKSYRVGATRVVTNARGFASKSGSARGFSSTASFEV